MTGAQKLSIISFGLAILIMLGVFLSSAMAPRSKQVLFWRLGAHDAASITEKLSDINVDWELKNGSLMVDPGQNLEHLRMSLAQDGLLPEDMSFDFEKMIEEDGFVLTKDERSQRFDIALMTELAKNIEAMSDIMEAKVFVTQEEPSPLLKTHQPRKASVRLKVRGHRVLAKSEVKGVIALVANAVKGLDPELVTVIDGRGRPYSLNSDSEASDKLEMTWKAERHYAQKIENMLLEFMPRAKATVSLTLDLKKHRKEIKDYQHGDLNKNGSSVLVNNFQEKKDSQSKEGSQGVAGAGTNSSADIREGDGGDQMKMGESSKKEAFDNSVAQEFITYDGLTMAVSGVSVVVVNKKLNPMYTELEPISETNQPYLDASWLDASGNATGVGAGIDELVAAAIGLENTKIVKIAEQNMVMPELPKQATFWQKTMASLDMAWLFMGILSLAGVMALSRMIKRAQPEEEILEMPEYEEEDKGDDLPPLKEPELDAHVRQIENRVKEIVDEDPVKAASLIRHWLSSE